MVIATHTGWLLSGYQFLWIAWKFENISNAFCLRLQLLDPMNCLVMHILVDYSSNIGMEHLIINILADFRRF